MKYIYLAATAVLMSGCPEAPVDMVEIPIKCSEAYAESVVLSNVDADNLTEEEREEAIKQATENACDAALLALDNGTSPEFWDWYDNYHTPAWKNQTEAMVEHCEDNLEYKAKMLEDSEIFKFRCLLKCDGFDEDNC